MPEIKSRRIPSYRLNKTTGRAVVTVAGVDYWLGLYDTPESREKYDRIIAEWLANGRQRSAVPAPDLTIVGLIFLFDQHAEVFYRKPDGRQTSEVDNYRQAMRPLNALYGTTSVANFGPQSLRAVREKMIHLNWSRRNINKQVGRIRAMFKWAVEQELVGAGVHQALLAVKGLQRGRTEARESKRVRPVADAHVDAVKDFVSGQVWAMIELQRITGMRPGEVLIMRACDIDMTGQEWAYKPAHHKTEHHGTDADDRERIVYLGARAQEIIKPFITTAMSRYLFNPAEAEAERLQKLHAERRTPLSCGNRPGTNRTRRPAVKPGDCYTVASYRRAIARACDQAFPVPPEILKDPDRIKAWRKEHGWHPHQLRHTAGTLFRKKYGLDAAKVLLGQTTLTATQVYAEQDQEKAREIMRQVG